MNDDLTVKIQASVDAEHARQPRCEGCARPGVPYEYNGVRFDGLIAHRGQRLCPACSQVLSDDEGVDILVVDDRPGMAPYVHNTVRDRDKISIAIPPHLRGIDGRDALPKRRPNHAQLRAEARRAEDERTRMMAEELLHRARPETLES